MTLTNGKNSSATSIFEPASCFYETQMLEIINTMNGKVTNGIFHDSKGLWYNQRLRTVIWSMFSSFLRICSVQFLFGKVTESHMMNRRWSQPFGPRIRISLSVAMVKRVTNSVANRKQAKMLQVTSYIRLNKILPRLGLGLGLFSHLLTRKGLVKKIGAWLFHFSRSPLTASQRHQSFTYLNLSTHFFSNIFLKI